MIAFLTVQKMTKRQPAKKATGAFIAVANMHIYMDLLYKIGPYFSGCYQLLGLPKVSFWGFWGLVWSIKVFSEF